MLAVTHAAFSTALYLGGAAVFEYQTDPVSWGLGYAILADARHRPADIEGRAAVVFFISVPLEKRFGHRTITHSFIGVDNLGCYWLYRCISPIRCASGRLSAATGHIFKSTWRISGAWICSGRRRSAW